MPLILNEEEGKLLGKKQVIIPKKLVDKLKQNKDLFGKYKKTKGFKRVSAIVDDDYNKRSNRKDKIHTDDKTISFGDLKRIDHDMRHTNPNPHNLEYVLPGGDEMKNWAHDTLRKLRTSVKKVQAVPPVPKLEKEPTKPKDLQKDVKLGNATVRLTEDQLLLLKEYHDQTVFNFDKDGNAYFEKNNYENYIDFLENIGKPGTLPASEWDESDIYNAIENAKSKTDYEQNDIDEYDYIESFLNVVCEIFIYEKNEKNDYFEKPFLELFNGYEEFKKNNNYYDECETIKNFIKNSTVFDEILDNFDNIENYLTPQGYQKFQDELREVFLNNIYDYDIESNMTVNERGLVYVERNIRIPKFDSPYFNANGYKDYYKYLNYLYNDIGYCFSWGENKGEAYCGSSFGVEGSTEIKLKCWVDPKDINWEETVYRNCYSLREEQEVYISSSGAKVEVFDIVIENGTTNGINVSGKSLIKQPIIIQY